jgi:hypothetical protein
MQILRTTITSGIAAQATNPFGLDTAVDPLSKAYSPIMTQGTGAAQADQQWHNSRTLAASTSEVLHLYGVLVDAFGELVNFARVKALQVANLSQTGSMTIGGAGTNPWVGPFGGGAQTLELPAGGILLLAAPADAVGWVVTNNSADQLQIANNDSANPLTYEIVIVGATA